jgi:hypothetical protein
MKKNKPTQADLRRARRQAAMPEVKRLVRKHGRLTIQACLEELRDFENSIHALEDARLKVRELEHKVGK